MLIKCPECKLQVSDKAITCPHCGYPLKRIVGHSIQDVTESVYTERSVDWLHEELKKIKLYV